MGKVSESSEELTARWKKEEIPLCESGVVFHSSSIEPDETKAVGLFLKGCEAARVSVDWRGSYVNAEKRSTIDIGIARSIIAKLVMTSPHS